MKQCNRKKDVAILRIDKITIEVKGINRDK